MKCSGLDWGLRTSPSSSHRWGAVLSRPSLSTRIDSWLLALVPHDVGSLWGAQGWFGVWGQLPAPAIDGSAAISAIIERAAAPQGAGSQAERPIIHLPKEQ